MNKCIIYYPFKINRDHPSASNIRPVNIIKGFEDAGYEVSIIEGNGKERKNIINTIKTEISNGEKYRTYFTYRVTPFTYTSLFRFWIS